MWILFLHFPDYEIPFIVSWILFFLRSTLITFTSNDIANTYHFQRMLNEFLIRNLGNVYQSVLVHSDIYKHTKVNDISYGP